MKLYCAWSSFLELGQAHYTSNVLFLLGITTHMPVFSKVLHDPGNDWGLPRQTEVLQVQPQSLINAHILKVERPATK